MSESRISMLEANLKAISERVQLLENTDIVDPLKLNSSLLQFKTSVIKKLADFSLQLAYVENLLKVNKCRSSSQ